MKYMIIFAAIITLFTGCSEEEIPYFCHLYGYINNTIDSTGIDGMHIDIYDIDPEQTSQSRMRTVISATRDSISGFFEMDSVCWGTSQMQGVGYVTIVVDSVQNPGYPRTVWQPDLHNEVDTVELFID